MIDFALVDDRDRLESAMRVDADAALVAGGSKRAGAA